MPAHEYVLSGDPERIRQVATDVLAELEFRTAWNDEWSAVAEKGSRIRSVLFGAFAPYVKVGVAIRALDDVDSSDVVDAPATSVLRLDTRASGLLGGVMGARKTRSGYSELRQRLAETLGGEGMLVEERNPGPSQLA